MLANMTLVLLLLIALTVAVALFRSLFRLWLDYRIRMAVLDKIEVGPHSVRSPEDVDGLMTSLAPGDDGSHARANRVATGLFIALFGLLSIAVGRGLRVGPIAVGLDMGGWVLLALGLLAALLGSLVYWVYRPRATS